jgi:DNA modification methylase
MINQVLHGDCLDKLKDLADNSVDAVVTDPPYGLSFMGKKWDYDVPSEDIWRECLRVLKPGGYLLAFAGTRTQHRMAVRIEDAGFEIRDMIAWVYGSGFPKSLNIGKAIDELQGNERKIVGVSKNEKDFRDIGKKVKEIEGIDKLSFGLIENAERKNLEITKGNSEYEGFGSALKPALEPITMARKPLSEKTLALNVLKWGTGGIDIDGSRVESNSEFDDKRLNGNGDFATDKTAKNVYEGGYAGERVGSSPLGRFPANFIHDGSEEVVSMFPNTKSGKANVGDGSGENVSNGIYGKKPSTITSNFADEGSAARFFYCAKASKSERNAGCEDMTETRHADRNVDDGVGGDNPRNRSNTSKKNFHPTVKPIALMEYLVKLVSKECSVVLDPFGGSGSTAVACKNTNRNYILIEREADYLPIINARIENAKPKVKPLTLF